MKKNKKFVLFLSLTLFICSTFPLLSAAAKYNPPKVTGVKTRAYETSITVSWNKSSKASGYLLYMRSPGSSQFKKVATTKKNSYTIKNLKPASTYYFRVRSYISTSSGKKYYSASYSKTVSAKGKITAPSPASDFKCYKSGNGKAYFSWNKGKNANGYAIYRYDTSKKKYVKIASSSSTSCTVSGLKNGVTYRFKIRSYRSVKGVVRYSSSYSSVVKVTPQKISTNVASVRPIYYKATVTSTVTASPANSSSKKQTVRKGTSVTVINRSTVCKVLLPNKQQVYINSSKLNFISALYTSANYSRTLKEAYVNQNGYSSPTKYLIWVSTYTQQYCLYTGSTGKWKLKRSAEISTGKIDTPTSTRICRITKKEDAWVYDNGTYQAPIVYFYGGNAFHSRLHNADGSIADARIGKPISSGCVRMYDEDIQYLYDNVPIGTTVVIY